MTVRAMPPLDGDGAKPSQDEGPACEAGPKSLRRERRRSESNRRIEVLQTSALPLGYGAGDSKRNAAQRGCSTPDFPHLPPVRIGRNFAADPLRSPIWKPLSAR